MAPAVLAHPEARPPGGKVLMAESSLARSAQESLELVECPRHESEECPRSTGRASGPAGAVRGVESPLGVLPKAGGR